MATQIYLTFTVSMMVQGKTNTTNLWKPLACCLGLDFLRSSTRCSFVVRPSSSVVVLTKKQKEDDTGFQNTFASVTTFPKANPSNTLNITTKMAEIQAQGLVNW